MKYSSLLAVILIITFLLVPNSFLHPNQYLPDQNDSLLITYIQNQVQENLVNPQKSLFYANFFAPYQNTLSYSDLFLTSSILTLPAKLFSASPILIFNLNLVSGFILTGLTTYLLIYYLTKHHLSGFLGSLLFTFSGFHLHYLPHLQIFNIYLLPLSLYFLLKYLDSKKLKFFIFFLISLTAQMADSFFSAFLIIFSGLIIFLTHPNKTKVNPKQLILVIPFFLISIPLVFPYLKLHFIYPEAVRSIRDAAHFSLGPEEIFTKYRGLTLLAIFGLSFLFKPKKINPFAKPFLYLLIFSLFMSLGPVLKFNHQTVKILNLPIPLPYTLFYYLFPGFNAFRTPGRWIILSSLAISVLAAINLKPNKNIILLALVPLLLLEAGPPLANFKINSTPPPVYQQVANLPPGSIILELPIKLWNMEESQIESQRSLYSLYHKKRRFNGYSGFAPLSWIELVQQINQNGLTPKITNRLKQLGVTHLVQNYNLSSL